MFQNYSSIGMICIEDGFVYVGKDCSKYVGSKILGNLFETKPKRGKGTVLLICRIPI